MTIKEESLIRALETSHMMRTGLPKRYDDSKGEIWIKAIVLVSKSNLEVLMAICVWKPTAEAVQALLRPLSVYTPICILTSLDFSLTSAIQRNALC